MPINTRQHLQIHFTSNQDLLLLLFLLLFWNVCLVGYIPWTSCNFITAHRFQGYRLISVVLILGHGDQTPPAGHSAAVTSKGPNCAALFQRVPLPGHLQQQRQRRKYDNLIFFEDVMVAEINTSAQCYHRNALLLYFVNVHTEKFYPFTWLLCRKTLGFIYTYVITCDFGRCNQYSSAISCFQISFRLFSTRM